MKLIHGGCGWLKTTNYKTLSVNKQKNKEGVFPS